MKKTITTILIVSGIFITGDLFSNGGGAIKVTSAPGEGNCTQCHIGAVNPSGGSVAITITGSPATYVPGQTYEINITANGTGRSKFGFALSAKDENNGDIGTFSSNGNTAVQVIGDYVTHSAGGTLGSTDSKTWKFNWTAPATNSGDIKFYASANAANGNNNEAGDLIFTTNKTFNEGAVGINEILDEKTFAVYPNPAKDNIQLSYELKERADVSITLFDIAGKSLETMMHTNLAKGQYNSRFNFSGNYPKGLYFLSIHAGDQLIVKKIFIQ